MTDQHASSQRERIVPAVLALAAIALGAWRAAAVGDADATGIVEDGLGGAGDAVLLAAMFVGLAALAVGVADGLLDRVRRRSLRRGLRTALLGGFGLWAGFWVWALADLDCDGSCVEARGGVVAGATATAGVSLGLALTIGWLVGRRARRRADASGPPDGGSPTTRRPDSDTGKTTVVET